MEGVFTGKEAYRQHFDPKGFFNVYMPLNAVIQEMFHKTFFVDGIRGDTLIDMGSGPSIYQLLSPCEFFREIIVTDLLEQNRVEIQKWLKKDPEALDWTPMVKYVCQLEGDREKWKEKEEKLRRTIKQVLPCDVTLANPLDPLVLKPVDCVISSYCLESACNDLPAYCSAMKNVGSLVKPGGHLIFVVAVEGTYYVVGPHKFSCLYLTPEMIREAVKGAGFEVLWSQGLELTSRPSMCDAKDTLFLVAKKPSESQ
ncbi:nicotinamide N-methyltransferase-like [Anolis sagrei]|uniref:nicotinamide N-methyltransferase-like n=1 Tax=Anolis sagrei TaxID=38937 RepID=UPI0035207627